MYTYVVSDIHGCFHNFINLLNLINFSDDDQLILAGDYIDRGFQNLEMLQWIENAPDNVLLIKGNHDAEFSECVKLLLLALNKLHIDVNTLSSSDLRELYPLVSQMINNHFFDHYKTIKNLINTYDLTLNDFIAWSNLIDNMPYYFKTSIDFEKYLIVHAGYISQANFSKISAFYGSIEEYYMTAREEGLVYHGLTDTNIIFGHTPTIAKGLFYNNGKIFKYHDKNGCNYYNIDCGCAYRDKHTNAQLACLRLEDKKEFYD